MQCTLNSALSINNMAYNKQEFIKNAFTPQVAVMCSPTVEQICQKNNLSFIELCQPFCKLNSDVHYKDTNGVVVTIRNFKLSFLEVTTRPPQTTLARKYLNGAVSDAPAPRVQDFNAGDRHLEIPLSAPWFEAWRETFLQVQYPSDHEYTKHFLACLLVVSSADANPVESMIQLAQTLNQLQVLAPTKLPKWFNGNVLRYYVIVHDNIEGNYDVAQKTFEAMRISYGSYNCFLLRMNSRPPGHTEEQLPDPWSQFLSNRIRLGNINNITPETSPLSSRNNTLEVGLEASETGNSLDYHPLSPDVEDVTTTEAVPENPKGLRRNSINTLHGGCLSTSDVEQIKLLISEFCIHAFVPYIEKQIQQLSENVANKKGVSRSLFSATKRWFSPNKPGSTVPINNLIYSPDSVELQMRKLGDLYFMFGHYSMAYQAYHSAKRDFNADQAWLYYAGALEMAALSAFMANEANRKTFDYMDESITTYLNTCKMAQFATRATLLSAECLKSKGLYGDAAHQLIRMTSEESDLRSALLLEQAAYCFLHSKPSMVRKYAFHMVLAGHRFSKAAQRKHSLRCYKQAYQVYQSTDWNLAEDHINYTIGRQANNLHQLDEAVISFSSLLTGRSKQSTHQQLLFLKEYITIYNTLLQTNSKTEADNLPLPVVDTKSIKLLMGPRDPLATPGKVAASGIKLSNQEDVVKEQTWIKLEEMLMQEANGSLPVVFKPAVTLYTVENLPSLTPSAIINEPVQVSIKVRNPLHVILNLKNIYLLWEFETNEGLFSNECKKNDGDGFVKTHLIKTAILQATSVQELILAVTPIATGLLKFKGICYCLISSTTQSDLMQVRGRQLFDTSTLNKLLSIKILPPAPCLQVHFTEMHTDVLCNEIQKVAVDLRNVSSIPLHNVLMASSVPHLISACEFDTKKEFEYTPIESAAIKEKLARKNHVIPVMLPDDKLESQKSACFNLWLKAPNEKGPAVIDLLIYYESVDDNSVPKYRLVRHVWKMSVQESIGVEVIRQQSSTSTITEKLALSLKVTNLNKVFNTILTEVSLLKVALLSSYWFLLNEIIIPKMFTLNSQETVYNVIKVKRKIQKEDLYSELPLQKERLLPERAGLAYLDFAERINQFRVNIFDDVEQAWKTSEGVLIVQWQASVVDAGNKRIAYGQSQITMEEFREEIEDTSDCDSNFFYDESKVLDSNSGDGIEVDRLQKQVTYNLQHPTDVRHNFRRAKLCVVPVKLILHSIVGDTSLLVTVNTLEEIGQGKSTLVHRHSSKYFRWMGNGMSLQTLEPYASRILQLSVAVLSPGTYDLGAHIQVWCRKLNQTGEPVLQACRIESAIVITNSTD